jgi:hypothetical protein
MRLKGELLTLAINGLLLSLAVGEIAMAEAGDAENINRITAVASPAMEWLPDGQPARVDFNFGDVKGWLRSSGEWGLEGMVTHNRLLCATYQLGMRFGSGHPACTDVQWLTPEQYATSVKQCNSAPVRHSGAEINPEIAAKFSSISCAESLLKCTGACD